MQKKIKKSCLTLILATCMIITNYSGSIIAHKSSENIVQVRGMSSDDVITDALKAKLNKTDGYIDSMVYFKDDTSNEDIQKLSKTIKTEESKDDKDRKAVIAQLSQTAMESQDGVLDWLEQEKESGNVKSYESFYIINAIHLKSKANLIEKLASHPNIRKIDINQKIQADNPIDKQPSNLESNRDEIEWNLKNIGADLAWNQGVRGQGVTVGIMDSAVDANHPALKRKFKGYDQSTNRVNFDNSNYFDAIQGKQDTSGVLDMAHGSHCTGIVLGSELNSSGEEFNRIGVAPDAQWINARIFDSNYKNVEQSSFIRAAEWMLAPGNDPSKAPQIINNSWGGSQYLTDTWFKSTVDRWRQAHILPVFAAGNQMPGESLPGDSSIVIPASYPESFAVGAVDIMGNLASFSKRGPSLFDTSLTKPEISAPGVNVRSSIKDTYAYMSGTSMAAPHVAGVAALVKSAKQNLNDREIQKILEETATPKTDSYYKTAPNNGYGHGIVNAYAAVVKAMDKEIGTIRGKVTSDGKPVEAEISVEGTDIKVKSSSSSGEFFLVYPSEGDIKISCKAFGYNSIDKTIKINKENTTHVDFDMVKKPIKNLEGSVSDKSGTKLSDVNVYLVEDATTEIELTGNDGRFSIKDVPVGEYTLRAFKHGYKFYEKKVTLDENSS
ncbi:S8 family serine peptidase, partial [Peptostreptococcus stomatis]